MVPAWNSPSCITVDNYCRPSVHDASYEVPDDLNVRKCVRTLCTWTVWHQCACGCVASVRRIERSASDSSGSYICTASHLPETRAIAVGEMHCLNLVLNRTFTHHSIIIHPFIHSFVRFIIRSVIHLFSQSFVKFHSCIHLLTYSCIQSSRSIITHYNWNGFYILALACFSDRSRAVQHDCRTSDPIFRVCDFNYLIDIYLGILGLTRLIHKKVKCQAV